jgi:hypothetical protein
VRQYFRGSPLRRLLRPGVRTCSSFRLHLQDLDLSQPAIRAMIAEHGGLQMEAA